MPLDVSANDIRTNMQLPNAIPLQQVVPFRSFAHGVRIIGSSPNEFRRDAYGGVEEKNGVGFPALIPEIIDLVGARLLKTFLVNERVLYTGSTYTDPFISTWYDIRFDGHRLNNELSDTHAINTL